MCVMYGAARKTQITVQYSAEQQRQVPRLELMMLIIFTVCFNSATLTCTIRGYGVGATRTRAVFKFVGYTGIINQNYFRNLTLCRELKIPMFYFHQKLEKRL